MHFYKFKILSLDKKMHNTVGVWDRLTSCDEEKSKAKRVKQLCDDLVPKIELLTVVWLLRSDKPPYKNMQGNCSS